MEGNFSGAEKGSPEMFCDRPKGGQRREQECRVENEDRRRNTRAACQGRTCCVQIHHPVRDYGHSFVYKGRRKGQHDRNHKKTYCTRETTPACKECENVRYIVHRSAKRVREQSRQRRLGLTGDGEFEIPNVGAY